MNRKKGKVLLAMSGGVDSSVAAALLKDEGYEVVGCFMRLGSPGETLTTECDVSNVKIGHQGCCSINDAKDAQIVAAKLDVPFYVLNFKQDFSRIINYFVDEYNDGRTPNPCVRCNDWLKFGKLAEYAKSIDATHVASGHYAQVEMIDGQAALLRGKDHDKDQSYVLFGAKREEVDHMLLPVGRYVKSEIRQIASELNLPVFNKPDSQEICFVPDMDYAGLIKRRTPEKVTPGVIKDTEGNTLGEHEGHQHYTIGQRRGVGVAMGYPIYVVDKNAQDNTITIGNKEDLLATGLHANQTNWLVDAPKEWRVCDLKIRYNALPVPGEVRATGDNTLEARFAQSQQAVAPGQAVVAYDGERVLGGGWIERAE